MGEKKVHDNYHDGVHDRTIVKDNDDGSKRIVDQRVIDSLLGEIAINKGERTVPPGKS